MRQLDIPYLYKLNPNPNPNSIQYNSIQYNTPYNPTFYIKRIEVFISSQAGGPPPWDNRTFDIYQDQTLTLIRYNTDYTVPA